MNFLNSYDSSDDEGTGGGSDKNIESKMIDRNQPEISSSSSYPTVKENNTEMRMEGAVKSKKRKNTLFTLLPIEIQNALTRGSTAQDNDSDDDIPEPTKSMKKQPASFKGGGLMGLLPPPINAVNELKSSKSKTPYPTNKNADKITNKPKNLGNSTFKLAGGFTESTEARNSGNASKSVIDDDDDTEYVENAVPLIPENSINMAHRETKSSSARMQDHGDEEVFTFNQNLIFNNPVPTSVGPYPNIHTYIHLIIFRYIHI
jgi:hypothetical protein